MNYVEEYWNILLHCGQRCLVIWQMIAVLKKKGKGGKNCVIKREVKFEDYEKVFGEMWINTGISAKV